MAKYLSVLLSRQLQKTFTYSVRNVYKHPELFPTLRERLLAFNDEDPEVAALVNIGFADSVTGDVSRKTKVLNSDPKEKDHLLDAALTKTLEIDLQEVTTNWKNGGLLNSVHAAATHYGIFTDLYRHGYFVPRVALRIAYPYSDDHVSLVHRGNIMNASEASAVPQVSFESDPDSLWTLVMTNLDGHLNDGEAEYLHWFVANIRGGDLSTGEEIVPYLQPFPPRGTGYHRIVFVLYRQDNGHTLFQFPKTMNHSFSLKERTFKTFDFYKTHQNDITPAGLCFFQAIWDPTLTEFFHNVLNMREPIFEYDMKAKSVAPQLIYPSLEAFNRYLDRYRDPKEIRQEVLLKRLKTLDPFKEEALMPKYPNLHFDPSSMPTWMHPNMWKESNRIGRFRDLRPHSIYGQSDFDFQNDMKSVKAGHDVSPKGKN